MIAVARDDVIHVSQQCRHAVAEGLCCRRREFCRIHTGRDQGTEFLAELHQAFMIYHAQGGVRRLPLGLRGPRVTGGKPGRGRK